MIGPRISTVFRSRWNALIWSVGILLTAYCSVPAAQEVEQAPSQDQAEHANPWVKAAD
ncbi:MAG: hypothetical protein H6917_05140 [Novosphingobium sp.]|nr:hypothetical protein [Novosphingobium sp.]MCP5401758.1 hypothetical protein [Novosphingobium sp.]